MLGGAWARQGPLAPRCHGQWPLLPAYLVGPSRLGLRRCASGSPLGSGLPYPAQKTAPEDRAPAAAGGFVGKDLTPCTRGGTERGKQGLCASKNRCPQGPRGPSCHPGLSPVNNVAAMSLESPGARASSILFQYQVLFKALPPVPRDSSPRGWPSEREVGGRAGLSTRPPPSRPNRLQGWGREKGEEKKKKDGVGAGLLLQADSWGKLQLLWRAPWGSSHAPEKLIFTLYS